MRFIARFLSFSMLAGAVAVAAVDAIRFVATGMLKPAGLAQLLVWLGLESWSAAFAGIAGVQFVLAQPAAAALLVLSLVLWIVGYRRPKPFAPFPASGARQ